MKPKKQELTPGCVPSGKDEQKHRDQARDRRKRRAERKSRADPRDDESSAASSKGLPIRGIPSLSEDESGAEPRV